MIWRWVSWKSGISSSRSIVKPSRSRLGDERVVDPCLPIDQGAVDVEGYE